MTQQSPSLEILPLTDLEAACRKETRRYRATEPSDPRFCLEIFRRALLQTDLQSNTFHSVREPPQSVERGVFEQHAHSAPSYQDEEARAVLVRIYTEFITANINRTATHTAVLDDLVDQVWLRFWQAANKGLSFSSLEAALTYLKLATISTLIETQRRERKWRRNVSLQQMVETNGSEILTDSGADLFAEHIRRRFRARCREVLTDPLEYRIFWMRYGMALPPREIARILSGEGVLIKNRSATARAVSDLLERSCRQLRDDPEIQELLSGD